MCFVQCFGTLYAGLLTTVTGVRVASHPLVAAMFAYRPNSRGGRCRRKGVSSGTETNALLNISPSCLSVSAMSEYVDGASLEPVAVCRYAERLLSRTPHGGLVMITIFIFPSLPSTPFLLAAFMIRFQSSSDVASPVSTKVLVFLTVKFVMSSFFSALVAFAGFSSIARYFAFHALHAILNPSPPGPVSASGVYDTFAFFTTGPSAASSSRVCPLRACFFLALAASSPADVTHSLRALAMTMS